MARAVLPLLAVLLLFAQEEEPAQASISRLEVTLDGSRVLLSLELDNAFDPQFLERIASGLPTEIDYRLRLQRDRKRWFDRTLAKSELQLVAMFNAVTREYLVNSKLDGKLIESRVVHNLEDLERAMTSFEALPVFTLDDSTRTGRMMVEARAELGTRTRTLLFIIPFFPTKITTDWVQSRKFRPPAPP